MQAVDLPSCDPATTYLSNVSELRVNNSGPGLCLSGLYCSYLLLYFSFMEIKLRLLAYMTLSPLHISGMPTPKSFTFPSPTYPY